MEPLPHRDLQRQRRIAQGPDRFADGSTAAVVPSARQVLAFPSTFGYNCTNSSEPDWHTVSEGVGAAAGRALFRWLWRPPEVARWEVKRK